MPVKSREPFAFEELCYRIEDAAAGQSARCERMVERSSWNGISNLASDDATRESRPVRRAEAKRLELLIRISFRCKKLREGLRPSATSREAHCADDQWSM